MTEIPLPKNPTHQRFADLVIAGMTGLEAYRKLRLKVVKDSSAKSSATRLLKQPDVAAYMAAVKQKAGQLAAEGSVLTALEKRVFFARIVRTPLMDINPDDKADPNRDLVKKLKRRYYVEDDVEKCTEEFEKFDALRAIAEDNKLSGDDPEANALQQMADMLAKLGHQGGTLPGDRM